MSLTKFTGDVDNIQSLPDKPTQTASQLKTLFDKTGADIKTYINDTLTEEIDENFSKLKVKTEHKQTAISVGALHLKSFSFTFSESKQYKVLEVYTSAPDNCIASVGGITLQTSSTETPQGVVTTYYYTVTVRVMCGYDSGCSGTLAVVLTLIEGV